MLCAAEQEEVDKSIMQQGFYYLWTTLLLTQHFIKPQGDVFTLFVWLKHTKDNVLINEL